MDPLFNPANVLTDQLVSGPDARPDAPADWLIEIPHGATRRAHFEALAPQLKSALPDGLIDFFFVNTDAGAPELAFALAERLVAARPTAKVRILTALVPRTFIDFNRVIDLDAAAYKAGGVTPGVAPYITDPDDLALLRGLHRVYAEITAEAFEQVCGAGGFGVMLHTYAPRSVDVAVDADIVRSLRHAYTPEVEPTWPLRPEVDLIARDLDGHLMADAARVDAVVSAMRDADLDALISHTYPMHPSTLAYRHAARFPASTLCVEVRRDLVADPFTPFDEMNIGAAKVARITAPLAAGLLA